MNSLLSHTNIDLFRRNHLLLVLTIVVTAICLLAGGMKVTGNPLMAMVFENQYGFPLWFMFFIGYAEVFGAISLWLKRWAFYGAQGLLVIGLGATAMHFRFGDGPDIAMMAWIFTASLILICLYHWRIRAAAAAPSSA